MDLLTPTDFEDLLAIRSDPCVSIYFPTHRAGAEAAQDRLRLKNLLDDAGERMIERGVRSVEARHILEPATALLTDSTFWSHQEDGLAVLVTAERTRTFRLPVEFSEFVSVSDRFHLKQLAPATRADAVFNVLALSQNRVRLLHATRFAVSEVELGDVPRSLAEALWYEDRERQLQFHQTGGGPGRLAAVFHGQGLGTDTADDDILRFFRAVDGGIAQVVDPQVPIVLAGVAYLFPLYREASRHPNIMPGGIEGNTEHISPQDLHRRALPLVADRLDRERSNAEAAFVRGSGPVASTIDEAVLAAHQARVDAVFLEPAAAVWGSVDPATMSVERHDEEGPASIELTDEIAVHTWANGGRVFLSDDIPGGGEVAAVLRF
jgi:hypothetical protein